MAQKDSDRAAVSHHHGQIGIAIPIKVSDHGHQGSTALGGKLERIGSRLKGAIPFSQKNGDRMAELIQYGEVRYPISVEIGRHNGRRILPYGGRLSDCHAGGRGGILQSRLRELLVAVGGIHERYVAGWCDGSFRGDGGRQRVVADTASLGDGCGGGQR